jgi:protein-disulfide isomerase
MSKKSSADRDRVREIREKANAARREEERHARRRRVLMQVGVGAAVVLVIAGIVGGVSVAQRIEADRTVPPTADSRVALASGDEVAVRAEEDGVGVGDPAAPVTLDVYEDYSCPHCAEYEASQGPLLDRLAASGQVRIVHHPMRIVTDYGRVAGNAAACVLQSDPAAWPGVHAALFANHSAATDAWKGKDFAAWLADRGVTDEAVRACAVDGPFAGWIDRNTDAALDAGVKGTPTLRIDGEITDTVGGAELVAALRAAGAALPDAIVAG